MANRDKGRRKWGEFSEDIRSVKLDKARAAEMRGGGNRASQAIYRPGSGPLRKTGRSAGDSDNDSVSQERSRPSSIQNRLKRPYYNKSSERCDSLPPSQMTDLSDKINDLNINNSAPTDNRHAQASQNATGDSRRRNKKPEQQLYVPKKVKEALAEQEITNRSVPETLWNQDPERENTEEHDSHSNQRRRNHGRRNQPRSYSRRDSESGSRTREDRGRRYLGNRQNRRGNEHEDQWRSDSPRSVRSNTSRKDTSREARQGLEPLTTSANHVNDLNRGRDSRSGKSINQAEKPQGKPPSGRWGGPDGLPKNLNLDHLPPRLQRKYLIENGLAPPNSFGSPEERWNGNTTTFQGAPSTGYPPALQHSQTMQHLPPSGPVPPQKNWSHTIPARGRGRNKMKREESESSSCTFRCVSPDQYSAPSSRSHTPSQEYVQRSFDRRGSNSTMYTSMESLSKADNSLTNPASSTSPVTSTSSANKCYSSPDNQKRETSPVKNAEQSPETQGTNNNADDQNAEQQEESQQDDAPLKKEPSNKLFSRTTYILDWNEDVELHQEAERQQARSASLLSLQETVSAPVTNPVVPEVTRHRRPRARRDGKHRNNSRDKARVSSRERQNNQQNRENENYNNNQNNSNSSRRNERRHRNIIQRSRESSKDRNYRGGPRNFEELHRPRNNTSRPSDRYLEENWRTGRKISTCESDEGRQSLSVSSRTTSLSNLNATIVRQQISPPSTGGNSQLPGVLILPESCQSPPNHATARQIALQQRTLFDPNNPHKPIIVTSPGSRVAPARESESGQAASVPVFQSHTDNTSYHVFQGTQLDGVSPTYTPHDQFGNVRPSWYDPYSDSFRVAKNPYLLLDIGRADLELQWILSSGGFTSHWDRVLYIRHFLQESLKTLLETDIKFCQAENVEQHFWKILFYNLIEMLRKGMPKESVEGREHYKKIMLRIIEEGTIYLESLLALLEKKYEFKLESFLATPTLPSGLGVLGLALVSAQKLYLFLGDLTRYREQANETADYSKSRQWYLKAQQLNPKNGRPYNQLALLAHYSRRKLDAVYYYMRSLMASNPFHSARESLIALFDENRKKYESTERKRKEEREWKERARMKEKEGANTVGGGLRRETWVHPGGKRVRRTTTAATANEAVLLHSDLEELVQLTSAEVNKRFVTSYLHVHGKLITKIGMETFQEAAILMLKEFRALLQHSPLPIPGTRLLQVLALNMFAIESTQLKDSQMEQGYRSEVQERALVVSLQMFNLILERCVSLLKCQLDSGEEPAMVVKEDMQVLLPAIKIWCDWMLCHSCVWNPPPSCTDYQVGPPGDSWTRLATLVNLLEKVKYSKTILIQGKDAEGREHELALVRLEEDTTLAGFTPLMSNPHEPCYVDKNTRCMDVAQNCLRMSKILFFGQVFLCGLETPVLKLQKNEFGISEYVSVVEASSTSAPSSPPEQSDSELLVESFSEDENEPAPNHRRLPSCGDVFDDSNAPGVAAAVEIRSLIERKEELERRQKTQDRHRQRVQAILQKSTVSVEIEVRPRQLVPDTNCFIDYLPQLQLIVKAIAGAQPMYTLMVPLVVLNELEGLARGADPRDSQSAFRAARGPEHVARVAENARAALSFARSRNPAIRCLTTRGTVLTSSTFTVEEDVDKLAQALNILFQDGLTRNDDRILATCLSLCKAISKDQINAEEGQPRRLRREVVLLTEDRNLRVKALARDVPVREVPDFMQWAGLG